MSLLRSRRRSSAGPSTTADASTPAELPRSVAEAAAQESHAVADPLAELRAWPVPPARGWAVPGGGRDHHVGSATVWQGTTSQLGGLFPFVGGSGSKVRGVPIGHD